MATKRTRTPDVSITMNAASGVVTIAAASPRGADAMLKHYGTMEDKGATYGYATVFIENIARYYHLSVATDEAFDAVTARLRGATE